MTALGWEHFNARERKRIKFIADLCLDDDWQGEPDSSGFAGLDQYGKVLIGFSPAYMRFLKRKLD